MKTDLLQTMKIRCFLFCFFLFSLNITYSQTAVWLMDGVALVEYGPPIDDLPTGWEVIAGGDFNGDNKADILFYNQSSDKAVIWLMDGVNRIQAGPEIQGSIVGNWNLIDAEDFDGDGKSDVLGWDNETSKTAIWLMDGVAIDLVKTPPGTDTAIDLPIGWEVIAGGDFNGDNKADILLYNNISDKVVIWLMDGFNLIQAGPEIQGSTDGNWKPIDAEDFDGDGKSDVLWWNSETSETAIWLMDGDAIDLTKHVPGTDPAIDLPIGWEVIAGGDFNGDNKADILLHNNISDKVVIWLMDGFNLIQAGSEIQGAIIRNWKPVDAEDFDGDGKSDVLWWDFESNVNPEPFSCILNDVGFSTQKQIDDFVNYYQCKGCSTINGDLEINGTDIVDLSGLSFIDSVKGTVNIFDCPNLETLQGLDSISYIGQNLRLFDLDGLTTLDGINGMVLKGIGKNLVIRQNDNLADISALMGLDTLGLHLLIGWNPVLPNLIGLENLTKVSGNVFLNDNTSLAACSALCDLFTEGTVSNTIITKNNKDDCNNVFRILSEICETLPETCEYPDTSTYTFVVNEDVVNFTAGPKDDPLHRQFWKFEEGIYAIAIERQFSYKFTSEGDYDVKLRVFGGDCTRTNSSQNVSISFDSSPENSLEACTDGRDNDKDSLTDSDDPNCFCYFPGKGLKVGFTYQYVGNEIILTDTSSDASSTIESSNWAGPYLPVNNKIPQPQNTSFTVKLIVENGCGAKDSLWQTFSDPPIITCGCDINSHNLILKGPLTDPRTYLTDKYIESTEVISGTSSVVYNSGEYISLKSGFSAENGVDFHALISGCNLDNLQEREEEALTNEYIENRQPTSSPTINKQAIELKAYPNPFLHQFDLSYNLLESGQVSLKIIDLQGNVISHPVQNRKQEAGHYIHPIKGVNMPEGLYFIILNVDNQIITQKIISY